jgi:hypothetical protein
MRRRRDRTAAARVLGQPDVNLLDVIDNVLNRGVVLTGEVTLGIADIDLIYLRLSALVGAADRIFPPSDTPLHRRRRR